MTQAGPCIHSVHFYESQDSLIERLCGVVSSGLQLGNSVLIVARSSVRNTLLETLNRLDVDLREPARQDRFAMYDANQLLETFMVGGMPDPVLFQHSVVRAVQSSHSAVRGTESRVTVFGEMVAILWERKQPEAALALESLWNAALAGNTFHLHCAYPRALFHSDTEGLQQICKLHSHLFEKLDAA